jgi:hypothetical protein
MQSESGRGINRKQFLKLSAAAPMISGPSSSQAQVSPDRHPNVLIIMTDQHRREYMGAAGSSVVPTPNIDRIAARGVRFTNAICPYPGFLTRSHPMVFRLVFTDQRR